MNGTTRSVHELLSFENPVLGSYVVWSAGLALKTALMSMLPTVQPFLTKWVEKPWPDEFAEKLQDDLRRVRAAHRNDLENNLLIIIVAFLYLLTDPLPIVAVNLLRIVVVFRCWHSLIYGVFPIRQPARSIGFLVPWFLMVYMIVIVMWTFYDAI